MSEAIKIQNGPFKGIGPLASEIRPLLDRNNQPVLNRDGKIIEIWGVHHKTPHALDIYNPAEGWAIVVNDRPGPFEMSDPNTFVSNGNGGQTMAAQPTVIFTAELINPNGRVLANSSVLCIINSTFAWSDGITLARSKLYNAMGLTAPFDQGEMPPSQGTPPSEKSHAPVVAGVVAINTPIKQNKLPAAAQAMIDNAISTGKVAQPEPSAESSSTPESGAVDATAASDTAPATIAANSNIEVSTTASQNSANPALNKNLLRQAEHRAKLHGTQVPVFENDEQVREFCKRLLKKVG